MQVFGQYEAYDETMWKTWTPVPESTQITVAPESTTAQKSGTALPILQSLINAAGIVGAKYFEMTAAKETAQAQAELISRMRAAQVAPAQASVIPTTRTAGVPLTSNWPVLAIVAIGAYLVARGGKSEGVGTVHRRRVRR